VAAEGNHPSTSVPNAPCGVERESSERLFSQKSYVPNAPCGVERIPGRLQYLIPYPFLMHRVELKAVNVFFLNERKKPVPNAPCGVESPS